MSTFVSTFTPAPSATLSIAKASVFDKAFGTPAFASVLPIKVSVAIFASLAIVTLASVILAVVTAKAANLPVVTFKSAM